MVELVALRQVAPRSAAQRTAAKPNPGTVARIGNLRSFARDPFSRLPVGDTAGCQPALRQSATLRYGRGFLLRVAQTGCLLYRRLAVGIPPRSRSRLPTCASVCSVYSVVQQKLAEGQRPERIGLTTKHTNHTKMGTKGGASHCVHGEVIKCGGTCRAATSSAAFSGATNRGQAQPRNRSADW